MAFTLPDLPYPTDALAPHVSKATLETHHGKHHQGYVEKTNELAAGTRFETMTLADVVRQSTGALFNNAAQAWNHAFYWNSMSPRGGGRPQGELARAIESSFGSVDELVKRFGESATGIFGSGWAWLVQDDEGALSILETSNADNPLRRGLVPLLTCDVWEHAYYLDRKNDRAAYVEAWWKVVDWSFAAKNLRSAAAGVARRGS